MYYRDGLSLPEAKIIEGAGVKLHSEASSDFSNGELSLDALLIEEFLPE